MTTVTRGGTASGLPLLPALRSVDLDIVFTPQRCPFERRVRGEDLHTGSLALQLDAQDTVLHGLLVAQAHPYRQGCARGQHAGRLPALVEQFEAEDLRPSSDLAGVRGPPGRSAVVSGLGVLLFFVLYLVVQFA